MKKQIIKFLTSILAITFLAIPANTFASKKNSFSFPKSTATKSYTPKAPYAGYGKISKSTGKIKIKPVHGYFKPSNGYKFVNPYARSK